VNLIVGEANYGWDPGSGYNESVPMTDLTKFPTAKPVKWKSGFPPWRPVV
jgi:aldose sugar dehydrogenase